MELPAGLNFKYESSDEEPEQPEMVEHDLNEGMRDAISKKSGFAVPESFEANMWLSNCEELGVRREEETPWAYCVAGIGRFSERDLWSNS